jgi:hypothetical protein
MMAEVQAPVRLEFFYGRPTEDPFQWLESFELFIEVNQVEGDRVLRFVKHAMREEAYTWYRANQDDILDWEDCKEAFLERFGLDEDTLMSKVDSCMQQTNESVRSYADRFRKLMGYLQNPLPVRMVTKLFVKGLVPHLKERVQMTYPGNGALAEIIRLAANYEQTFGHEPIGAVYSNQNTEVPPREKNVQWRRPIDNGDQRAPRPPQQQNQRDNARDNRDNRNWPRQRDFPERRNQPPPAAPPRQIAPMNPPREAPAPPPANDIDTLTREMERLRIQISELQRPQPTANFTKFVEHEQLMEQPPPEHATILYDGFTDPFPVYPIYATKRPAEAQPEADPPPLRRRPNNLEHTTVDPRNPPRPAAPRPTPAQHQPHEPRTPAAPAPAPARGPAAHPPADLGGLPPLPNAARPAAYRRPVPITPATAEPIQQIKGLPMKLTVQTYLNHISEEEFNKSMKELKESREEFLRYRQQDQPQARATNAEVINISGVTTSTSVTEDEESPSARASQSNLQRTPHEACYRNECISSRDQRPYQRVLFTRPLTKLATETSAYHPDTLVVDENILKDIKILKKHYLFTPVDKLATSFAVICNVKAAKDIIDDLLSNNIYRIVPIETDVLVERLRAEMRTRFELSTHSRNTVIPQYIGTWKAHSSKFRFICTANRSPLKTVYQHCTKIFRVLMPKIKALWDKTFIDLPQELKPFFPILKNAEEYIGRISDFNRIPPQQRLNDMLTQLTTRFFPEIHSFDFDRLYTGIPLDDLEAQISKLLEDLWAFAGTTRYRNQTLGPTQPSNALILKITGETCKWVPYNIVSMHLKQYTGGSGQFGIIQRKDEMLFDIQAIKELFSYSVRNTYLRFGDKVFEQIIGIPMGANHCVYVANLYLFQYEHDFFKQLIQVRRNTSPGTPGQLLASQLLHAYHYIGRFVDDKINMTDSPELFLNFLNKEHQEHGILGIYPAHLGFKVTSSPSKTSNDFLNLHLHIVPHYLGPKVLTGIFRKDSTFFKGNVHPTRMPSFHSVLPAIYKFNVLHSQVVTYARLCNNHQTFTLAVSELMEHFHVQAYPMRTMWKKLGKSLRRIPKLYGCVDTSIFRRIYAMYHKVVK